MEKIIIVAEVLIEFGHKIRIECDAKESSEIKLETECYFEVVTTLEETLKCSRFGSVMFETANGSSMSNYLVWAISKEKK